MHSTLMGKSRLTWRSIRPPWRLSRLTLKLMLKLMLLLLPMAAASGQPASPSASPTPSPSPSPSAPDAVPRAPLPDPQRLGELATGLLRDLLPREYENRKKWGQTEEVVSGVKVRIDGLHVSTHRRWKTVNHGLWKRYHATLVDPQQELRLRIERLEEVAPGRVGLDVVLVAKLELVAQLAKWQRNVRIYSVTAEANATAQLRVSLELSARLDPTHVPPDIVLDVTAQDAELQLQQFRLRRLSDVGGDVAQQVGKLVQDLAEDELADQRHKLVDKINAQIAKHQDRLRLSLRDLIPGSLIHSHSAASR